MLSIRLRLLYSTIHCSMQHHEELADHFLRSIMSLKVLFIDKAIDEPYCLSFTTIFVRNFNTTLIPFSSDPQDYYLSVSERLLAT